MSESNDLSDKIPIPTPGEILVEEFLAPMGLSQNAFAEALGVSRQIIDEIVLGRRPITADMDLRFARFFGMSEGFWLRVQTTCDQMEAQRQKRIEGNHR